MYIGYWITKEDKEPIPKKMQAILAIQTPKERQLRAFIGVIIVHKDFVDMEVRDPGSFHKDDIQVSQMTMD